MGAGKVQAHIVRSTASSGCQMIGVQDFLCGAETTVLLEMCASHFNEWHLLVLFFLAEFAACAIYQAATAGRCPVFTCRRKRLLLGH